VNSRHNVEGSPTQARDATSFSGRACSTAAVEEAAAFDQRLLRWLAAKR
jgi:hypothetical protein